MVSIEIDKSDLKNLIGKNLPDEEIEEVLFLIKCEAKINGNKIECELTPDRPDMFAVEGLAREIKGFLALETGIKKYDITDSNFFLKKDKADARPAIACGIILDVKLTDELVKSLMQMQEKLHATIGRNRKRVAIGVHDFDKIKPPLLYTDVADEKFVPLNESNEMPVKEILEHHPKGKDYAHLVKDRYPMLYDKDGVISFPPIINSERTKVTDGTKNLFIDVTGDDEKLVNQVLNILVCNINERDGRILTVKVSNRKTPDLEPAKIILDVELVDKILGLGLSEAQIEETLKRMRYNARRIKGGKIEIEVPPYRTDILHMIDIVEDVAIGYGYNNIQPILPKIASIGKQNELEKLSKKIREVMIGFEFQEVLNFVLTNEENNFKKMDTEGKAVEILNPVSSEYSICRTWLLPSLLKVLSANKHRNYPQKIFEVGDCISIDESSEVRTRQTRKLAAAISYDNANLTEIKSILESALSNLGYAFLIKEFSHPSFLESRCGEILINDKPIGFFGELHPKVLENWKLEKPVIVFEIKIE
jgi:phenylalanyl-tRNA synthetase beta chain